MKFTALSFLLLFSGSNAFSVTERRKTQVIDNNGRQPGRAFSSELLQLSSSPSGDNEDKMKKILAEESMNEANMKQSAEQLKNMTPTDIERMISEMDSMPAAQMDQMKAMGMDVDMMKNAMQMMKSNPSMMESMGKMMENMSPEQLMQQSKLAQKQMANMGQNSVASTPSANIVDVDDTDDEEDDEDQEVETTPEVLDAMYRIGEIMSDPQISSGGVTFEAFSTLPPISVLLGNGSGEDCLSRKELKECWETAAKDPARTSRVDRAGFEKVWNEVQEEFYNNIVEESRDRSRRKTGKKGSSGGEKSTSPPTTAASVVGANIDPAVLSDKLKNLSEDDLTGMFDQMNNMTPEQEERMKSMNVDPEMMKKSAEMMKNNPLLRNAASMMMKNASPEQLMKASQQAQEKISNMSEADKKKMMDSLK